MTITFSGQNYSQFSSGYYCGCCGQWVYYGQAHFCSCIDGNETGTYFTPFDNSLKHYKCPKCKGEFSEPFKKFTGKYKKADIIEFGTKNIISRTEVPIEKTVCPFCGKEMKGLN